MGVFHFLNVKQGDCSIIQHAGGHVSVIDICNASEISEEQVALDEAVVSAAKGILGNFNEKDHPVNPIAYMKAFGMKDVFRFIVTHPDMDHIGGIRDFFKTFSPTNFWDTDNHAEKDFGAGGPHDEGDWLFYKKLRDESPTDDPKRLTFYAGAKRLYFNRDDNGGNGDGLYILAPTPELVAQANKGDEYNDLSYVLLYRSAGGRVLMAGDSHDGTWEHILANHADDVRDVELLIAPHHGRHSDRSFDFLDVVNPRLTFFGNASSEHLAYDAWRNRSLPIITNNQAGCMVVNTSANPMEVYVTNKSFAQKLNAETSYEPKYRAYFCGTI
ncbi:MAG TPA: hypothetical protein VGG27_13345 [Magnetospirillaceae bacterium]|jgi:beta-lactamase superfamily II metal-dependent hydrolase